MPFWHVLSFFINWPDYCYCIDKLYFMGMSIIGIVAILVIVYFLYKSVKPKKKRIILIIKQIIKVVIIQNGLEEVLGGLLAVL